MFEPVRGGTRGGQAEFKWSDVSADKDREHYLGHSINAPTGRWQKNKDVHWYNRDVKQTEAERQAEIRKVKEAEAEALSQALGFGPSKKSLDANTNGTDTARSPIAGQSGNLSPPADEISKEKLDRQMRKMEKRAKKAEKKALKEAKRLERGRRKDESDSDYVREDRYGERRRSPSPRRHTSREYERSKDYHGNSRRSASPPPRRDARDRPRDYDYAEQERERERDRRRWEVNAARDRPRKERRYEHSLDRV